ncbi:hypothetical protein HPB49_013680 [Dermacentor silvarum]|uniref:Uncharacterized protein n=1 Tax=Dermacentor silvarum TaxID=543639 RepID=A0ACB8CFI3_DERSI|nr:hypothetical protein HPB49_013680 [Dermacentor silvarum]
MGEAPKLTRNETVLERDDSDSEIPSIPDLGEVERDDLTTQVAQAPSVPVNQVDTFQQLDNELLKQAAFTTLDGCDLRLLTKYLTPEEYLKETLAINLRKPMRVLGWYHSHPHITVWPSHVDVQTQAIYQMMDEGFVGLIFSVFSEDATSKLNQVQVTCFQSVNQASNGEPQRYVRMEIPLHIVPSTHISNACLDALVRLPEILCQEEQDMYSMTKQVPGLDLLTRMHNNSVFVKALCNIAESVSGPLLQSLENRLRQNRDKIERMRAEKEELLQKIALAEACASAQAHLKSTAQPVETKQ